MIEEILYKDKKIKSLLEAFYNIHQKSLINLTSIKEEKEFYIKHYLDSIYYFEKYLNKPKGNLADIGSGGGFPGVVIGIFYPQLKITLIESISKKCIFLRDVIKELNLNNIEVLNKRVENIKDRSFDIITARGVSVVKDLIKNSWSVSRPETFWIMYKGEKLLKELKDSETEIKRRSLNVKTVRVEEPFKRTYCIISR